MQRNTKNANGGRWLGTFAAAAVLLTTFEAHSEQPILNPRFPAPWKYYENNMVEPLATCTTFQAAISAALTGSEAGAWANFEPGEFTDCSTTTAITQVAPALYSPNAKIREIVAWWLNKKNIFDPNVPAYYIYGQVVSDLKSNGAAFKRMCDVNALGEFHVRSAVPLIAGALTSDSDPTVRAAAAAALVKQRLDPTGALSTGIKDADSTVQLASLAASLSIPTFNDVVTVTSLLGSTTVAVRRQAIWNLEAMGSFDALTTVLVMARSDADPTVRAAACHYAGSSGSTSAQSTMNAVVASDTSVFVVDQAKIALLRL